MKKKVLMMAVMAALLLTGCAKDVSYVTKYVTNTVSLDMREEASNESSIICTINKGEAVSYIEDAKNGFSKVAYNGSEGYVLATYLTLEKPQTPVPPAGNTSTKNSNDSSPTPKTDSSVEDYVANYVRPLYNNINDSLEGYVSETVNGITYWSDGGTYVKKSYPSGTSGYDMSREYYYDKNSGQIVFAFVFSGEVENRLYFRNEQLVRYIGPDGVTVDNPTGENAISMASYVLSEAY